MAESAALLTDEVLPLQPLRQWVLSLPFALRLLLATNPKALTRVLGIFYQTISSHLLRKARLTRAAGAPHPALSCSTRPRRELSNDSRLENPSAEGSSAGTHTASKQTLLANGPELEPVHRAPAAKRG